MDQLEFGFMDEFREQEEKARLAKRVLPFYPHPRDDNQRLLNYQHDWLIKQDPEAWRKLWNLARKVARRMIQGQEHRKGFALDRFALEDRVDTAVTYVLRRYQSGWYVQRAYLKAIKEGVIHALWYRTMADENEHSTPDEILATFQHRDKDPFHDEKTPVLVEGMTRQAAEARIKSEFLFGDMLLNCIDIVGGENEQQSKKGHKSEAHERA